MLFPASVMMILLLAISTTVQGQSGPQLVDAIKADDFDGVRRLTEAGADINEPNSSGAPPLLWAVQRNNAETVALLIRAGAHVNVASRHGATPLHLACTNGNLTIIEILLNAGADANVAVGDGETPLMTAARGGKVGAAKMLLAHGARVNVHERWKGQTALMWAAADGHGDVVRELIDHGADVDASSHSGFTALLFAVRVGDTEAVKALLSGGATLDKPTEDGTPPLHVAIINAHYELAAMLVGDYGADPNADGVGWTALQAAVWAHRRVRANLPDPTPTGNLSSLDLIKILLANNANPNARLVKQPRDRNYMSLIGATPFLMAAKLADASLMRLLIEHGADPLAVTNENTSALLLAAGIGYFEGESPGSEEEALEAVKVALEFGAGVNMADNVGDTALHGAVVRGSNLLVRFLVDKGAQMDAKNEKGWTPLTIADGVYIARGYKTKLHTAALLRELMSN